MKILRSSWDRDWRRVWRRRSRAAKPDRYYGDGGTIHHAGHVNIEVDAHGVVVSCWFRCQMVPFSVHLVNIDRAEEMRRAFAYDPTTGVNGAGEILTGVLVQRLSDPPATIHWSE